MKKRIDYVDDALQSKQVFSDLGEARMRIAKLESLLIETIENMDTKGSNPIIRWPMADKLQIEVSAIEKRIRREKGREK